MLGAIIGDIVGSRFEFNNTDNYNFELFTEESTFTDLYYCYCGRYQQWGTLRRYVTEMV